MKRIVFALFIMAFVVVVFDTVGAQEVSAPTYFSDESWVYELVTDEVAPEMAQTSGGGKESPFNLTTINEGGTIHPDFASAPVVYELTPIFGDRVGAKWLKFPFKVGDSWPVQYRTEKGWRYGMVGVEKRESVAVRAGTFEAYKLVMNEDGGSKYDVEYWYATAAKAIVKVVAKRYRRGELMTLREFELTSYKVH